LLPLLLLTIPILLALLFWLFVFAEGTYLGSGVVTFLYDRAASSYDRVKRLDVLSDRLHVALPLGEALSDIPHPLILDVATGTGRVPVAIANGAKFSGRIIGLDLSARMLREAQEKTRGLSGAIGLVRADALALPVLDATCDAVTCLEGLELFARPDEALGEMARVLRPGGILVVSSRVEREASLLPGRAYHRDHIGAVLQHLSFTSMEVNRWQRHYDLVWAKQATGSWARGDKNGLGMARGKP